MNRQNGTTFDADSLEDTLDHWEQTLCSQVGLAGLLARSSIANKWKAPYRYLVVRECLFWRVVDVGRQCLLLMRHGHFLGARALLRSALETVGLLLYLNHNVEQVIAGTLSFLEFEETTKKLLMGSRNQTTSVPAVNILTVLKKADKKYPGMTLVHEDLSETTHPNYAGVVWS